MKHAACRTHGTGYRVKHATCPSRSVRVQNEEFYSIIFCSLAWSVVYSACSLQGTEGSMQHAGFIAKHGEYMVQASRIHMKHVACSIQNARHRVQSKACSMTITQCKGTDLSILFYYIL
jgi:hypothetical protein